jgi:hypothetical protein
VRRIPPEEASGELAGAYQAVREAGFEIVPAVFQLAGPRPDIVRNLAETYRLMFHTGKLPRTTKEAVATWVSALNQCPY